jgi:ABC-type dipeptide/oligopeptide/nickel transport system permease subunit
MRWRFVARRLVMLLVSLVVASFVIFAAVYLAPGSPVAALSGEQPLPPGSIAVLEQRYHLNEPFLAQYWYWLDNALHGNLGISITLRENVSTLIASRAPTTAGLVLYASLIIVVLGIGLGILSGLRPGWLDTSTLVATAVAAAIPAFVAAIALIGLFAVRLGWFPALGNGTGFLGNVRPYVAGLEVQGAPAASICLRHLVPNIAPLILAQATILFGYAMVDLAAISFLGLGVQPPAPNWGVMISENQQGLLEGYPLPALAAGACIVAVVIAVNVLGERLFERARP